MPVRREGGDGVRIIEQSGKGRYIVRQLHLKMSELPGSLKNPSPTVRCLAQVKNYTELRQCRAACHVVENQRGV